MDKLREKIGGFPDAAGVYLMKDAGGRIIYIGKAKSLKKRIATYFGRDLSTKTVALMSNVCDIEFRLTPTEAMALLLEASLIHRHQPKYNVSLRDNKSFPLVKITNEKFPAICITRKREDDGARYFGPYTSANLLREALKIIRRDFPHRSCKKLPQKACIYYRIGLSPTPCIGAISPADYAKTMENISLILEGRTEELVKKLSQQMDAYSKEQNFEAAAKIRDQINTLSAISSSQSPRAGAMEAQGLKDLLRLEKLPQRIEAFDISNIYGKEATGSMVSFFRCFPDKDNYRKFRIKTVGTIDDYKMLREVIHRRYARLAEEKLPLPDLILIDGGKGHLLSAADEIRSLGMNIPLVSIAKKKENIYTQNNPRPIRLKEGQPVLNLIRRIRDEAHRFAVSYHHVLRRKKIIGK